MHEALTFLKNPMSFFPWFRQNWFALLCLSLLIFIAFFPKVPLFELIPGYIVRARLEDLFLAIVTVAFGVQLLRGKATLRTPITPFVIAYVVIGILSMISALYIVQTVPLSSPHPEKMLLHFLRRLEYLSIFFLFYNAVKQRRHVRLILIGLVVTMIGISIYGFGQKYLYWPVYSTMNREFSKGMRLVLTEHARVPSTFGGHYDMSAFVMFLLTILLSLIFFTRNKVEKGGLIIVFVMGFWLLILGASRSSFLSYLVAVGILVLFVGLYKRSLTWTITRGLVVFAFSLGVMVTLGDLSSRFSQLGIVKQINQTITSALKPMRERPSNTVAVDPLDKTDQQPIPAKVVGEFEVDATASGTLSGTVVPVAPGSGSTVQLPPDVYKDIPDLKTVVSTESGKTVVKVIEVPREFSQCTYRYGLSACIRFETLWPRALNGLIRNPLVGSGYSTLTKEFKDQFTEAESTDNDFLRTLGEIGILGAIAFYGPIALFIIKGLSKVEEHHSVLIASITFGIIAGSIGMLFNALYIDVFAASKVAFLYWAVMGLGFAALKLGEKPTDKILADAPVKKKKR